MVDYLANPIAESWRKLTTLGVHQHELSPSAGHQAAQVQLIPEKQSLHSQTGPIE
jgi:hypothetical protein